jgi:hypothetical protein
MKISDCRRLSTNDFERVDIPANNPFVSAYTKRATPIGETPTPHFPDSTRSGITDIPVCTVRKYQICTHALHHHSFARSLSFKTVSQACLGCVRALEEIQLRGSHCAIFQRVEDKNGKMHHQVPESQARKPTRHPLVLLTCRKDCRRARGARCRHEGPRRPGLPRRRARRRLGTGMC